LHIIARGNIKLLSVFVFIKSYPLVCTSLIETLDNSLLSLGLSLKDLLLESENIAHQLNSAPQNRSLEQSL